MFEWSKSYSVGVTSVDAQHRNLFAITSELHAAMVAGQGKAVLRKTLERLVRYTEAHFAHEERLMLRHKYPELEAHRAEHRALTGQVKLFQAEFEAGRAGITSELFEFLKAWLQNHIRESDSKCAPYFRDAA